jgi:hypothetical protein
LHSLANYEVVYLVYWSLCSVLHFAAGPTLSSWLVVMMTEWTLQPVWCTVLHRRNLFSWD